MKLNIVLYQPEIPPNTGSIIRTCVALNARLHIIKPIGFDLDPMHMARSGAGRILSDIPHKVYANYEEFKTKNPNVNIYYLTRYGTKNYADINYEKDAKAKETDEVWVMFGRESTGIDKDILFTNLNRCLRIPMYETMRSINLSNSVAIVGFEISRQFGFKSLSKYEVQKGKNYLTERKWEHEQ